MLYLLEPEVAGGMGENTVIDKNRNILYLEYEFSGWLGDEILETTPCFITSYELANEIQKNQLSGYEFQDMEISVNEEFCDLYPDSEIPPFGLRLIPMGIINVSEDNSEYQDWSGHDFCFSNTSCLVVTEKALKILKMHKLNYCEITELKEK